MLQEVASGGRGVAPTGGGNFLTMQSYDNHSFPTPPCLLLREQHQGRVDAVRISPVHDTIVANFSVMTEHMYETSDGNKVVEATWMCVAAFEGGEVNIQSLTRGAIVHLTGRLRTNRYIDASGCEMVFTEVLASSLKVLG